MQSKARTHLTCKHSFTSSHTRAHKPAVPSLDVRIQPAISSCCTDEKQNTHTHSHAKHLRVHTHTCSIDSCCVDPAVSSCRTAAWLSWASSLDSLPAMLAAVTPASLPGTASSTRCPDLCVRGCIDVSVCMCVYVCLYVFVCACVCMRMQALKQM